MFEISGDILIPNHKEKLRVALKTIAELRNLVTIQDAKIKELENTVAVRRVNKARELAKKQKEMRKRRNEAAKIRRQGFIVGKRVGKYADKEEDCLTSFSPVSEMTNLPA